MYLIFALFVFIISLGETQVFILLENFSILQVSMQQICCPAVASKMVGLVYGV